MRIGQILLREDTDCVIKKKKKITKETAIIPSGQENGGERGFSPIRITAELVSGKI